MTYDLWNVSSNAISLIFKCFPARSDLRIGVKKRPIPLLFKILILSFLIVPNGYTQTYQPGYTNELQGKKAFQREIARVEITVARPGEIPLPITLVPRVQKDDILRVKMVEEPINGIRPNESLWDWTLLVAFINPSRNEVEQESVSREVNFKRDGWYREHLFKVPYDSQPIFFLYPKSKYRKKIQKLINKNFGEIQKIGEKTLEIAGAYAQIGIFLNELQGVINQNPYGYGSYSGYSGHSSYGGYGSYGSRERFGPDFIQNQLVERLAQSFNIALPSCWNGGNAYAQVNDFVGRAQCVAKNVRLEDFDLSVNKMLQQGGLLAATKLVEKYPQLAYWINVAAAAADLILKILKRTPLKIVPTMAVSASEALNNNRSSQYNQYNSYTPNQNRAPTPPPNKISLFAEAAPTDGGYVTAFPIVLHKWQAQPDPELISLPVPSLMEPCLHMGQNILKNTDLSYDWLRDKFSRDFKLIVSAENGFLKEFALTKSLGFSGWMLNFNPQDIQAFPKVRMNLEAKIVATRGFNQIESEKFSIPISGGGQWEVSPDSIREFSVGGKRRVVIKNTMGSCRCLQSVKYKPSFGGEFTFVAGASANPLRFTEDGIEAWFEIDTTHFQAGQGNLELHAYGNDQQPQSISFNLYPGPPKITKLIVHRGDRGVTIEGERIEQIKSLSINGKTANLSAINQSQPLTQKTFVFQNYSDLILSKSVSLNIQLDGERFYEYPESFAVLPSRPAIESSEQGEIEAIVVGASTKSPFDLSDYPVVPTDTKVMTAAVRTTLTDYGFRTENVNIETRIENGAPGQNLTLRPKFEVLDSLNMRIEFSFDENNLLLLAGRRLQFRIRDSVRGDSDWYSLKQTFIRIPNIESVVCREKECTLSGVGLDYIGQISIDGGEVWQPPQQVQISPNGKSFMKLSPAAKKSLIKIKLRDFPKTEGLKIW